MSDIKPLPENLRSPAAVKAQAEQRLSRGLSEDIRKIRAIMGTGGKSISKMVLEGLPDESQQWQGMGVDTFGEQNFEPKLASRYERLGKPVVLPNANYKVVERLHERGGKESSSYQVKKADGSLVGPAFRREDDAKLMAAFLNESNSMQDPRAVRLVTLVESENSITKAARQLLKEKEAERNADKRKLIEKKIDKLKRELTEVKRQLGV